MLCFRQEEKAPVDAQTNDDDVMAQDLCVLPKLPPNMKGWLGGVQKEYIEQAHLPKFLAIYAEDPATGKEIAYAAVTALLKKYDWHLPFNKTPTLDYDSKEVLTPEDALITVGQESNQASSLY
ncbi:uncharacterized protein ARMOST_21901 [Armillaria ostoyae]|uniref:Uncharacterized protein n=1 Tax=Armillaria ostoyae TaxID=47428 RepID=A0A284SBG7_ARMOS|nr:uncharacterized protein ARMOST_21901 [Armillaria ostoyae]